MNEFTSFLTALVPILVALLGASGWLIRHERERREDVEKQLSPEQFKSYETLLEIFFEVISASREGKQLQIDEIASRMTKANKDLIVHGSDQVIKKYEKWQMSAKTGTVSLTLFAELIIAIRKDMGHSRTKLSPDTILRSFIKNYDEEKAKGTIQ